MNWLRKLFQKAAAKFFSFAPKWARHAFSAISTERLIKEGYKANSAVSACATTLQLTFPEPPLLAGVEQEGRFVPDYKHPMMELLNQPNPDMGWAEFAQFAIAYCSIGGNLYGWKQRMVNGRVKHIWPFSDVQITPVAGRDTNEGLVAHYEYDAGDGQKIAIPKGDIVHWKWMVDPQYPWRGIGAIELSAREVDRDNEATAYIFALLKNNAVPPVVITLEEGDDSTQEQVDAMSLKWVQKHSQGQPAFISNGMKVEQMGFDLQKLASDALADVPETRIAANFHVPSSVAGLNVGVKRSDYGDTAARKAFTEQTLMALWRSFASEMLNGLKDEFPNIPQNFKLQFDVSNVGALQELRKDLRTSVNELWKSGLLLRSEAKKELGMKPNPGDDVYFISLASEFVPVGEAVQRSAVSGQQSADSDQRSADSGQAEDEGKVKTYLTPNPSPKGEGNRQGKSVSVGRALQRVRKDVATRMKQAVDVYFSQLADRVVERLAVSGKQLAKAELPRASELLNGDDRKKLETLVKRFYIQIIELSWNFWNVALGVEKAFDLDDPLVTELLKLAATRVKDIHETTLEEIREALKFASENGWGVDLLVRGDETQRGLRDLVDEVYKDRARTIARTELGEAQNAATASRYKEAGVKAVEILDNGAEDDDDACKIASTPPNNIWTLELFEANPLQHPNCTRAAAPYFGDEEPLTSWDYV